MSDNEKLLQSARAAGRKIAVIGGGTGLSNLLLGLKEYTDNITAIVTVADDGGGSGVIRRDFSILPPGDIRNCIMSLANTSAMMDDVLNYRFTEGYLTGQNLGNLIIVALTDICGSFEQGVSALGDILAVTGRVLPVTKENISLKAYFENGTSVIGESKIAQAKKKNGLHIHHVELVPKEPAALPRAVEAIMEADAVILGPGSLFTSIIPNLLVDGIVNALKQTSARRMFIMNVMTQEGETEGFSAFDHIEKIISHAGENIIDCCIYNTREIHKRTLAKYADEGGEPIHVYEEDFKNMGICFFGEDILSRNGELARHDPLRLAHTVMKTLFDTAPRRGQLWEMDKILLR